MGRQVNDEIDTVNKGWRVDDDGWRGSPQDNDEGRNRLLTSAAVGRRGSMRATTCCRRGPLQDNDDVVSTVEGGAFTRNEIDDVIGEEIPTKFPHANCRGNYH